MNKKSKKLDSINLKTNVRQQMKEIEAYIVGNFNELKQKRQ